MNDDGSATYFHLHFICLPVHFAVSYIYWFLTVCLCLIDLLSLRIFFSKRKNERGKNSSASKFKGTVI